MPFVLDTSVTAAWALKDEASPYADAALRRLRSDQAIVPPVWPLEIANVLLVGERRGRISPQATVAFLNRLANLDIEVDDEGQSHAWGNVLTLARAHQLSAYDASYLDLALRRGLPLATQDNRLKAAAGRIGVPIYDPAADAGSSNGQDAS